MMGRAKTELRSFVHRGSHRVGNPVNPARQGGVALVVAMLLLLALTALTLASVQTTNTEIAVIDNYGAEQRVEYATRRAIERLISDPANFDPPSGKTVSLEGGKISVDIDTPVCRRSVPMQGFSLKNKLALEQNYWHIRADAREPGTGTEMLVREGVRILMNAGGCP